MNGKGAVVARRRRRRASFGDWVVALVVLAVMAVAFVPQARARAGAAWESASSRFGIEIPHLSSELPWGRPSDPVASLPESEAATLLKTLPVRDSRSADAPSYDRSAFGQAWADEDRNGCDTRNDVLARDLARPTFKPGTKDCVVLTGTLAEPYTGATVEFRRGQDTSALVQIDHVVALGDAWRSGAWQWDASTRQRFANDPSNLLAVDGRTNEDKSASAADEWLPPNAAFRCEYATRQIRVKSTWGLSVTAPERAALAEALATCPS